MGSITKECSSVRELNSNANMLFTYIHMNGFAPCLCLKKEAKGFLLYLSYQFFLFSSQTPEKSPHLIISGSGTVSLLYKNKNNIIVASLPDKSHQQPQTNAIK